MLFFAGASAKGIAQVANPYPALNSSAIRQRAEWSAEFQRQTDLYRRFNDPYTLPAYDQRSVYYWNSIYNPHGPNYMYKNKDLWNGSGQQGKREVDTENNDPDGKNSTAIESFFSNMSRFYFGEEESGSSKNQKIALGEINNDPVGRSEKNPPSDSKKVSLIILNPEFFKYSGELLRDGDNKRIPLACGTLTWGSWDRGGSKFPQ